MNGQDLHHHKLQTIAMICAFLLLLLICFACIQSIPRLEPVLLGDKHMILEYGQEFSDPGIQILLDGQIVDAQVSVYTPSIHALGSYTIHYNATYGHQHTTAERTVTVVDTQAPEIILHSIPGQTTEPGTEYQEEGYTATDIHDGDLTDQVQRTVLENEVQYTVTDSSGNCATVTRPIDYTETEPPKLTLLGASTVLLVQGESYEEPGYTATDWADRNLSDQVTVTGVLDTSTPGTYTLTYRVTDPAGNSAKAARTIIVKTQVSEYKVVYLTFDDGPSQYTPQLLEILRKYNVKATFFVVGTSDMEQLDDIAADGHAIGVHSNTHVFEDIYSSEDAFFRDFWAIHNTIYEKTGIDTNLCRFPGGGSNTISKRLNKGIMTRLAKALDEKGFTYFDWNVDSNDAGNATTAEKVYENVITGIQKNSHSVVLLHDIKPYSVEAVEWIIQWALENGYIFLPLDETSPTARHPIRN